MRVYDWYKVFNLTEFEATGLVSQSLELVFDTLGVKTLLVTKGNLVSVTFDDVMLAIGLNSKSPFEFEDRAIYLDENDDVWVGILNEEESA